MQLCENNESRNGNCCEEQLCHSSRTKSTVVESHTHKAQSVIACLLEL